jgi:hypothetical protein
MLPPPEKRRWKRKRIISKLTKKEEKFIFINAIRCEEKSNCGD